MILRPGCKQFIYSIGDGDVRVYDIYESGKIIETTKCGDKRKVKSEYAINQLDKVLEIAKRQERAYKQMPLFSTTSKTRVKILNDVKEYILLNCEE